MILYDRLVRDFEERPLEELVLGWLFYSVEARLGTIPFEDDPDFFPKVVSKWESRTLDHMRRRLDRLMAEWEERDQDPHPTIEKIHRAIVAERESRRGS